MPDRSDGGRNSHGSFIPLSEARLALVVGPARLERPLLEAVLAHTDGNQIKAAALLGINRNTLRKKITDLGISVPGRP